MRTEYNSPSRLSLSDGWGCFCFSHGIQEISCLPAHDLSCNLDADFIGQGAQIPVRFLQLLADGKVLGTVLFAQAAADAWVAKPGSLRRPMFRAYSFRAEDFFSMYIRL